MDPLNDLSTLKSCLIQCFITSLHFFLSQEHQHLALSFTNKIFIQTHGKVFFRKGREMLVQIEINEQVLKGKLGQKSHLKKMAPVLTILSNARVWLNSTVYQNLWSADNQPSNPRPGTSGTTPTCQNHDQPTWDVTGWPVSLTSSKMTGCKFQRQNGISFKDG